MSDLNPNFTDVHVKGVYDIMKCLSEEVVFEIKDSVTKKTVSVSSAEEAFKAIIAFSSSPQELLQRKKITRNLLIQYAFDEKIHVAATADKKEIITKILDHWKKVPPAQLEKYVDHASTMKSGDLYDFGHKFASWFYNMLNSQNQQMNVSSPMDFGPQHFWSDAVLLIKAVREEAVSGAAEIAERLLRFMKEGLYFHANLNDGVATESESHGLICVIVHGTVHKEQCCLGPFEQAFILLQDPSNNDNWKIRKISLNVYNIPNESQNLLSYKAIK